MMNLDLNCGYIHIKGDLIYSARHSNRTLLVGDYKEGLLRVKEGEVAVAWLLTEYQCSAHRDAQKDKDQAKCQCPCQVWSPHQYSSPACLG